MPPRRSEDTVATVTDAIKGTTNPPTPTTPNAPDAAVGMVRLTSFVADGMLVILFVALGRDAHSEGSAVGGTLTVAGPFLIALAVSWVVVLATIQRTPTVKHIVPTAVEFGVPVWLGTLALGMLLRHTAFDKSTAFSFIVVAFCFLGAFLVGWRALWRWKQRRSTSRTSE